MSWPFRKRRPLPCLATPDWRDLVVAHVYGRGWIFKGTPEGDAVERRWLWRTLAEGICAASGRHTCVTDNWRTRDRFVYEPGQRLF